MPDGKVHANVTITQSVSKVGTLGGETMKPTMATVIDLLEDAIEGCQEIRS
jgi:hypothetical protein